MYTDTTLLANGRVPVNHYQTNGCATIIPNGNVPHEVVAVAKLDNRPLVVPTVNATATQKKSTNRNYEDDHTVLAGVVIDWGHGWGWNQTALDNAACTHEPVTTSTVYCHAGDDYAMGGMDEVDWCAFGDFSF